MKAGEKVDVAGYEYELWSRAPQPGCWWATRQQGDQTIVRIIKVSGGRWTIPSRQPTTRDLPLRPTDPITHARTTDPVTSKAAARHSSVRAGTHKARLLLAYSMTTAGYTDREAAFVADLLSVGYWKRCSDLRNDGLIEPMHTPDGTLITRDNEEGVPNMVCSITDLGMATLSSMKETHAKAPEHVTTVCVTCGGHNSVHFPDCDGFSGPFHSCDPNDLEFDGECEACCRERHPVGKDII